MRQDLETRFGITLLLAASACEASSAPDYELLTTADAERMRGGAAARSSSSSSKTTALCVRETELPPFDLLVEDSVLGPQVVDHLSVAVIDQGGQQDHHQRERALHWPSVVEMNAVAEERAIAGVARFDLTPLFASPC